MEHALREYSILWFFAISQCNYSNFSFLFIYYYFSGNNKNNIFHGYNYFVNFIFNSFLNIRYNILEKDKIIIIYNLFH